MDDAYGFLGQPETRFFNGEWWWACLIYKSITELDRIASKYI